VAAASVIAPPAGAQSARNVLLVINASSADSQRVGEHYARVRGIDQEQVLRIEVEGKDEITRANYDRAIEQPVAAWLNRHSAQDRILFIVLTKGIPLRIAGTAGRDGTTASVDSELAVLYRKMSGRPVPPQGQLANPYFLGDKPIDAARPFSHEAQDIFLVTRLDGFTADDAVALIDRAQKPAHEGRIVLDMKAAWSDKGNAWLKAAADRLAAMGKGDSVTLETTSAVVTGVKGVLGYYSWGSNDPSIKRRSFDLGFLPGALAGMFVSSDGRTFKEPPADWMPSANWNDPKAAFDKSPQSLAGDLIREGVTGIAAHVSEPFLDATIRPDVLFPAYLSGYTLAEAYYLAMPYVSWQTIVVGDPLCAVAPLKRPDQTVLDPPIDPATEMPRFYSQRRLESVQARAAGRAMNLEAQKLALKAEARFARDDKAAAEQALIEATALEPRLVTAQMLLASAYEQRGERARAIERYRTILAIDANNVIALNNLAYALAVYENKPGDALPLAERAYAASKGEPTIADTLGWVHHLLGNESQAAGLIGQAVQGAPGNAEIQLHGAIILAQGGKVDEARKALERAIELDPTIAEREEARQLKTKLGPLER
jgi:uncharacterized protein (TIGR03790 family)